MITFCLTNKQKSAKSSIIRDEETVKENSEKTKIPRAFSGENTEKNQGKF